MDYTSSSDDEIDMPFESPQKRPRLGSIDGAASSSVKSSLQERVLEQQCGSSTSSENEYGHRKRSSSSHCRGVLKLSVYMNSGMITVHIIQAKNLSSEWDPTCCAYVKVSLVPDEIKRTRCRTNIAMDTNHPLFDEKFSFELLDCDIKKRLLISMWNQDELSGANEFLGCMSFGVQHIYSNARTIKGWYHLLTERFGRHKHQKAVVPPQGIFIPKGQSSEVLDEVWMDTHSIVVMRGPNGFGFTVSGHKPVQVCGIEKGSTADLSDLRVEDCIMTINDVNVYGAHTQTVANMIRMCKKQVKLEVQRANRLSQKPSSMGEIMKKTHVLKKSKSLKRKSSFRLSFKRNTKPLKQRNEIMEEKG